MEMKKVIGPLILLLFSVLSFSQIVEVSEKNYTREMPVIGFNGNTTGGPSWINTDFRNRVESLNPQIIRYPGGNLSNWWDWENRWFVSNPSYNGYPLPDGYASKEYIPIGMDEYNLIVDQVGNQTLFCLNIATDTLEHQIEMLKYAESLGIEIKYIELGNELNFAGNDIGPMVFPTAGDYARTCNVWIDSIRNHFPDAEIALVGENRNDARAEYWNDSMYMIVADFDAITHHDYYKWTDPVYDYYTIVGGTFDSHAANNRKRGFNEVPSQYNIWVTEYNYKEKELSSEVAYFTWTQSLVVSVMNYLNIKKNQVSLMTHHNISSSSSAHGAIYTKDNVAKHTRANGVAMKLLLDAIDGMESVKELEFYPMSYFESGGSNYPGLLGMKFFNDSESKSMVINLMEEARTLSVQPLPPATGVWYEQYYADKLREIVDLSSVTREEGSSTWKIELKPRSVTIITGDYDTGTADHHMTKNTESLVLHQNYPNPFSEETTLSYYIPEANGTGNVVLRIYDSLGRMVAELVNQQQGPGDYTVVFEAGMLTPGLYFCELTARQNRTVNIMMLGKGL
ncbi:MAG: T9SS type A sorting domain-containing protein [Bacteroidota bacterium]